MFVKTIPAQVPLFYAKTALCLILCVINLTSCGKDYLMNDGEGWQPGAADRDLQVDGDSSDGDIEEQQCPQVAMHCLSECYGNIAYTCENKFDEYGCRMNVYIQEDCLDYDCVVSPEKDSAWCERSDGDMSDGDRSTDGDFIEEDHWDGDLDDLTDGDSADGDVDELIDGDVLEASIVGFIAFENPANVLSFFVEWQTDVAVPTRLEADCGSEYMRIFKESTLRTAHRVFVMGLFENLQCTFTAVTPGDSASQMVNVGPLPTDLPELEVVYSKPSRMQAGWTLFNLTNKFDELPLSVAMVDERGRFRWYYKVLTNNSGSDNDVSTVPEGVLIGGIYGGVKPHIISWDGRILWKEEIYMHHHIELYGDNQLIYLWREKSCTGEDWEGYENLLSDKVVIWDRVLREPVWEWVFCHHYTPDPIFSDWAHANSVEIIPGEQAMLISARKQDALFKVDMDTGEVIWKLGRDGDFKMAEESVFLYQHAAEILPNGNILLFDNGRENIRKYSRAVELSYSVTGGRMTADLAWSYTPQPEFFAFMWGDADRLPNGNTLATFGVRSRTQKSRLVEASEDNPGQMVWHLDLALKWGVYRAERVTNPPYGYILDNTEH